MITSAAKITQGTPSKGILFIAFVILFPLIPPNLHANIGHSLKTGCIKQDERKTRRFAGTVEEFIAEVRQEPHLLIIKFSEAQLQSLLLVCLGKYFCN
jgi:hypothetical protein